MRKNIYFLFIAVITFVFLSAGCGKVDQGSPSGVVKAAYMAANESNYSRANKFLTSKTLKTWKKIGSGVGVNIEEKTWDKLTRERTIEKIKVLKEKLIGKNAVVSIKLYFKDNSEKKTDMLLEKENGIWKIVMG